MLKLLFAIACENVIVADTGTTSLVNILEKVNAEIPDNVPVKIMMPMKWSVIVLWTRGDLTFEEPVKYEQRLEVRDAEGDSVFLVEVPFEVSNTHGRYRNTANFLGFPLSVDGIVNIEISLRRLGDKDWVNFQTYPIETERKVLEVLDESKNEIGSEDDANESAHGI